MSNRIYLDYVASTPVDTRVMRAMEPYFTDKFGNPGSLHSFGQEAIAAVDASREALAAAIGADFREVVFTGSATEANNIALRGVVRSIKYQVSSINPRIIISAVEHESILEVARTLEREGVEVVTVPVDEAGVVDIDAFREALNERTVLVSVMYANNEIGTVQPITKIAGIIRDFRKRQMSPPEAGPPPAENVNGQMLSETSVYPVFHSDAVQALQFLDCGVDALGVDLMTLSAHKIYGPKGVGALFVRTLNPKPYTLDPIITGGNQEFGLRSGTENVPLIAGFAEAVRCVAEDKQKHAERLRRLRNALWEGVRAAFPSAEVNGTEDVAEKLPNVLNAYIPGVDAQDLLTALDLEGVAVSAGSACRARSAEPSYVIEAISGSKNRARQSVRMSVGRPTTEAEIDTAISALHNVSRKLTQ